jgi:hypothetical protein
VSTNWHPDQLSAARLRQAYAYWNGKRGVRGMPARTEIDPIDMRGFLPYVMLVDVLDPLDFRYRLIGTEVRNISHRDYTGMRFSDIPGKGPGSVVWSNCQHVVQTMAPFSRTPPYVGPQSYLQKCENLLLPLSSDGASVTTIMQVISFERGMPAPPRPAPRPTDA